MKYHGSGRRVWVLVLILGLIYAGCAGLQQNEDPIALMTDPDIVTGTEWSDVWGRSR